MQRSIGPGHPSVIGNPAPWPAETHLGDNLWTESMLAYDPDTESQPSRVSQRGVVRPWENEAKMPKIGFRLPRRQISRHALRHLLACKTAVLRNGTRLLVTNGTLTQMESRRRLARRMSGRDRPAAVRASQRQGVCDPAQGGLTAFVLLLGSAGHGPKDPSAYEGDARH
jgi:hypothetical protein